MKIYKSASFLSLIAVMSMATSDPKLQKVSFGVIVPDTSLVTLRRAYKKKLSDSVGFLMKGRYTNLNLKNYFRITYSDPLFMSLAPSPTDLLNSICDSLLPEGVSAILFFSEYNVYGRGTASIQYFLQLTGYLNIPVISWNAYNIGLEQRGSDSRVLQLAPTVEHQSAAMLSILRRYSWHQFCIVTTPLAGHDDFIRSIRDQANDAENDFKYQILDIYVLKSKTVRDLIKEMKTLAESEARVMLLFCLREEAEKIMFAAEDRGITGKNYVWIVTQSVVGEFLDKAPVSFPRGMLGIHLNISKDRLMDEIENAVIIFGHGLELLVNDNRTTDYNLVPAMDCNVTGNMRWSKGGQFYNYLRNVSVSKPAGEPIEFNADGTLKYVELELVNLGNNRLWHKIGAWTKHGLVIKDIIWPGDSPAPPPGVPEKFNMKVTFMEEPPYVNMVPPDNETGECKTSRAVRCRVAKEQDMAGINISLAIRNPEYFMCCSGFCIDLLEKFATDLKFTYELYRVEDGIWGILKNNTWNGLVKELINHKADAVVTSFKINSERQTAVDFTVPFMDTGIAIVVAKRTGIISPKAFLEPFDTMCWLIILLVTIQAAAIAIFLFEWLSPFGYDMKMKPPRDHKFSLFRTYWLVWAILFGASVNVDCPRGYTARFMSIVWAMFAVVFLAIYTANLAAFMITREEFHDLTGIEDKRLENPMIIHPPFRFGTIPNGNTEAIMKHNKPELYRYMKKFDRPTVQDGIKAVKKGTLDAFIYDATVLEYLVSQDNECRLLTAGNWYAMSGYGFAFPKKSKYLDRFNKLMIKYRETGDIERLQRFWLQGVCKPNKHKRNASKPLDVNQFMSAFLLLGCGVLFTLLILALEHLYFSSIRKHLARKDRRGYFALLSLSMGKSLTFRGAVYEAQDLLKHHRCKDPVCDTQLWKARRQLDVANMKIMQLEAKLRERNSRPYLTDMTMNLVNANNAYHLYNPPRCLSYRGCNRHEIAEIETVL